MPSSVVELTCLSIKCSPCFGCCYLMITGRFLLWYCGRVCCYLFKVYCDIHVMVRLASGPKYSNMLRLVWLAGSEKITMELKCLDCYNDDP